MNLTYVRGKGWVYEQPVTMKCGTQVILEIRQPKRGEMCIWDDPNGLKTYEQWKAWAENSRFFTLMRFEEWAPLSGATWCVFTRVSD